MKVTLEKVFTKVKPTKFGDKLSVGLKVKEDKVIDLNGDEVVVGDRFINGWFKTDYQFPGKEGEEIEIVIKQRGDYLDFSFPKDGTPDNSGLAVRVSFLEKEVASIKARLAIEADEEPDF